MGISGKFACVFSASATLCRTSVKVVECFVEVDNCLVSYRSCPCFSPSFVAHGIFNVLACPMKTRNIFSVLKVFPCLSVNYNV